MSMDVEVIHDAEVLTGAAGAAAVTPVAAEAAPAAALPKDWPHNAVLQTDGSVLLTLRFPVVLKFKDGQGKVTEKRTATLVMKPIKGKHQVMIRQAAEDDFRVVVLSCSTGISQAEMQLIHDEMDARDLSAALLVFRFFTTPGLLTGP